jgi:hypothetical protein
LKLTRAQLPSREDNSLPFSTFSPSNILPAGEKHIIFNWLRLRRALPGGAREQTPTTNFGGGRLEGSATRPQAW